MRLYVSVKVEEQSVTGGNLFDDKDAFVYLEIVFLLANSFHCLGTIMLVIIFKRTFEQNLLKSRSSNLQEDMPNDISYGSSIDVLLAQPNRCQIQGFIICRTNIAPEPLVSSLEDWLDRKS